MIICEMMHVATKDFQKFSREMKDTIENYQNKGLIAEIHYNPVATGEIVIHCALVLGKTKEKDKNDSD